MAIDIKAPQFPESVADGTIATWHKQPGEAVSRDELIVDIETDKVVLEVVAPADGAIQEIKRGEGDTVESQEVIGTFEEGAGGSAGGDAKEDKKEEPKAEASKSEAKSESAGSDKGEQGGDPNAAMSPAARRLADEAGLTAADITGTGKGGRITKEDVVKAVDGGVKGADSKDQPAHSMPGMIPQSQTATASQPTVQAGERAEKRVPMTRLRKRVAERLLDAKNSTAMLTTFNEVNMKPIMDLRSRYKETFEKTHNGTRLGFMSFFIKAAAEALRRFPEVNASIDGDDIVYHGFYDIGVAVSSDRGLVVPVLRDTDQMSLATMESTIRDFGKKAQEGKLGLEDMQGGTFTITNGGVFGSLLSTPILNPPQTAILGMHKIQERPMAVNGEVKVLPMMYLALSYDHRLIDGKEAVQFLVAIKDMLEDPARILLEL
ncbi:2-oxoglutarate dehydrogenase complex dihydrolipoyllysine-residue succinyltransferase [Saccharospirillum salsuginis]|uniref:Dihydrolipoyllysine-residue succinyltransferase component of 2-oxoglutarate dehydrogenase complex n=1 Tax=Saccharospirillum salsuginis TaxID=418750 RepID=A0A918K7R6_9GAMM|nr:2-oxoglutarate dehydrogenase complex dihydrolipoyllysine-residue succinyltransferase [Saccharospirillum salsuginis]GGX53392.1 dihydrolipoyllysine-residue succinyltransferase component of 2-oxoglutarate dehydrogenase complex [Saccharospirillum salsuginis]